MIPIGGQMSDTPTITKVVEKHLQKLADKGREDPAKNFAQIQGKGVLQQYVNLCTKHRNSKAGSFVKLTQYTRTFPVSFIDGFCSHEPCLHWR